MAQLITFCLYKYKYMSESSLLYVGGGEVKNNLFSHTQQYNPIKSLHYITLQIRSID